ncbi:hypothetical protein [Streptomyces sp. NPDC095602]|uniref:hypothetical protein n=1 Tax=Streptomyces sp. NPDC095602 TaxID=3155819 RepID=UPI003331B35D
MTTAVPMRLLPHTVTVVDPVVATDAYGNTTYDYGPGATRTQARAWLEQTQRSQVVAVGADPLQQRWLMVTNHHPINRRARIEWPTAPGGLLVFELDGQPGPLYNPLAMAAAATTAPHHTELTLKVVDG